MGKKRIHRNATSDIGPIWALLCRLTVAIIIGCMTVFTRSRASADDLIGIRCVGYEVPIVMFPSGKTVGFASKDEPFDMHISLS